MRKKKILLNWLPPALDDSPSPSMSVLKNHLEKNGFEVTVIYWNIILNDCLKSFMNLPLNTISQDISKLIPFYTYLSINRNDGISLDRIIYYIISENPKLHALGYDNIREELTINLKKFKMILEFHLEKINIDQYSTIGFSVQFSQWIAASVLIDIIKQNTKNVKIVVGGIGTKPEALAFMENFKLYDYAIWGEGETPFLNLCEDISNNDYHSINNIPRLVYRDKNGEILCSNTYGGYLDLNTCQHDISDYYKLLETNKIPNKTKDIIISVEGGRGCHWSRCKFCFLNSGYKFRVKSPYKIIEEIKHLSEKYNTKKFAFLDNDIIGKDPENFNILLDHLIALRDEKSITIEMAEIITKDINADTILKMHLAGFKLIQIGYESPSDNLLSKINKKNTFASNLLLIKWATYFDIEIGGLNVICNLLEETEEDINEGIENLNFLRFYFASGKLKHNMSTLAISNSSRYFKEAEDINLIEKLRSATFSFLPEGFINKKDVMKLFFDCIESTRREKWNLFEDIESHYINNSYTYRLTSFNQTIFYQEVYNHVLIKEIEFEPDEAYWKILKFCNRECRSLSLIHQELFSSSDIKNIMEYIKELKQEGLIYTNSNYEEVITIVNTDSIHLFNNNI